MDHTKANAFSKEASPTVCGLRAWLLVTAAVSILLSGCAVGPDFKKPAAPNVDRYTSGPLPAAVSGANTVGGRPQLLLPGGDISAEWWTLFHSKPLNELIDRALANNPDLKAAQAALAAARENVLAQRGAFFPSISAGFSASRQSQSQELAPTPNFPIVPNEYQFNLFTPEVTVSYAPDVFGLNRRTVESLEAQQQGVRFQMIATYTTLTSNVVVTAIQKASVDSQVEAVRELVAINAHLVKILQYQFDKGYASGLDLAAQKAQLAQTEAMLPPLLKQATQLHDLLAVLTGRFPSQAPDVAFELSSMTLPDKLPVSIPSALVAQRPDIRQAEATLHAASAQIGIAVANRLPDIQLTAAAGSSALAFGQLFMPGTNFWNVAGAVTEPIFDGNTLLHQERAARDAYRQAAQQYRSTVLAAFQNVADTLTALEQDGKALEAEAAAADAAKATLDLAQRQLKDGYAGYPALLNAEQSYQQARINLAQAEASRYADTAALFQALGGGWWHREDLTEDRHEQ
ncbi:MAG: efflux transporter outer membrane subunit [Alphaproteobacteria bacterium]|nr:efflux transporter outer membrane subunit [Alphaproteobacteria bacterium]MDE2112000.1 efflux transporter outer membrane subunit [Alphaproteobacteria bacterium]MDE2492342.1 efflux transporter outer membrane subunit [Alphaproteobacteria bacterium]